MCEVPFYHVFSDDGAKKHQCPGLKCAAHAATSLTLCKQISVLPFVVQSMSLKFDKNMILSSKDSGFHPFRNVRICTSQAAEFFFG